MITPPAIVGIAAVGTQVAATTGTWSVPVDVFNYFWMRCDDEDGCVPIPGAMPKPTYVPVAADAGKELRVIVTAISLAASRGIGVGRQPCRRRR